MNQPALPKPSHALNRYRNRIVGHEDVDPLSLMASPKNFRVHPHGQEVGLESILSVVGWCGQIMCNRQSGTVVDGHLRVAHAISQGEATVPVVWVDLDDAEENLILAAYDALGTLAVPDVAKRDELYDKLQVETANNLRLLFGAAEEATGSGYGGGESEHTPTGTTARWSLTFPSSAADTVRATLTELTDSVNGLSWTENG